MYTLYHERMFAALLHSCCKETAYIAVVVMIVHGMNFMPAGFAYKRDMQSLQWQLPRYCQHHAATPSLFRTAINLRFHSPRHNKRLLLLL
jgi:hypothetical protein